MSNKFLSSITLDNGKVTATTFSPIALGDLPAIPASPVAEMVNYFARPAGRTRTLKEEYLTAAASSTTTVCDFSGLTQGYIAAMWIAASSATATGRESSLLKIYRDGQATPDVSAQLGPMHAASYGAGSYSSNWMGWTATASYFNRFCIPYNTGFKIELVNADSGNTIDWFASFVYVTLYSAYDWGRQARFKVNQSRQLGTAPNSVVTLLDTNGRGIFMGLTQTWDDTNNTNLHFMEGNHKFYLDGESSPSLEWSGTEDYYENGGYFNGGVQIGPHVGCVLKDGTTDVGAYRFHDLDPITFDTRCKLTWNCGDTSQAAMASTLLDHFWCAYYYLDR